MKAYAFIVGVLIAALGQAQDIFGDGKRTFLLMPAEVVASGVVDQVEISGSSRFVIYRKATLRSIEQLQDKSYRDSSQWCVYDRTSKQTVKLPIPGESVGISVLGDGSQAFYFGSRPTDSQGFINLSTGAITTTQLPIESITYYGTKKECPFLMVQKNERMTSLIRPNGSTMTITTPVGMRLIEPTESDANNIYFSAYQNSTPRQFGVATYSLADGIVSFKGMTTEEWQKRMQLGNGPAVFVPSLKGDLMYVKIFDMPKDLKTDMPTEAKLGLSNCRPEFSTDGSYVTYLDGGALLLREIKPVDGDLAKKLLADAAKALAISKAKQAALALIMYASDMDDVLPGAEGWEDKVMPYSLDKDLLKSFNYTFKGGNMNGIEEPASTELGFVMGPGGRAVAYTDGHVKWIPNP